LDADHWLGAILIKSGDMFSDVAARSGDEKISVIAETAGINIERIVSPGQKSPPSFWYDQDSTEGGLTTPAITLTAFSDDAFGA
jgi:cupin 2 domain-containing protein